MPTLLSGGHPPEVRVKTGDVLLVVRELKEREPIGGEPVKSAFYALAMPPQFNGRFYNAYRLDTGKLTLLFAGSRKENKVYYVPEDEWPDAVHALRAKAMLLGVLDDEQS